MLNRMAAWLRGVFDSEWEVKSLLTDLTPFFDGTVKILMKRSFGWVCHGLKRTGQL